MMDGDPSNIYAGNRDASRINTTSEMTMTGRMSHSTSYPSANAQIPRDSTQTQRSVRSLRWCAQLPCSVVFDRPLHAFRIFFLLWINIVFLWDFMVFILQSHVVRARRLACVVSNLKKFYITWYVGTCSIHIYIYIYIYTHTHTHTYIHACMHTKHTCSLWRLGRTSFLKLPLRHSLVVLSYNAQSNP